MERLPKDVTFKIALDLSPQDLINFCVTEKKKFKNICDSENFWRLKLEKDYPELYKRIPKPVKDPKRRYIKEFTFVSRNIEQTINGIITGFYLDVFYKNVVKYLDLAKYQKDLYEIIYKVYKKLNINQLINIKELDLDEIVGDLVSNNLNDISLFSADAYEQGYENTWELMYNLLTRLIKHDLGDQEIDFEDIPLEGFNIGSPSESPKSPRLPIIPIVQRPPIGSPPESPPESPKSPRLPGLPIIPGRFNK